MSIATNSVWVKESPIVVVDGEVKTYGIVYKHDVSQVGTMKVWKNGTSDESATVLSGNLQANGNVLTLKTIDFTGYGNSTLVAEWSATVNGQTIIRKCKFFCKQGKSVV
jgi:hypothetical protein